MKVFLKYYLDIKDDKDKLCETYQNLKNEIQKFRIQNDNFINNYDKLLQEKPKGICKKVNYIFNLLFKQIDNKNEIIAKKLLKETQDFYSRMLELQYCFSIKAPEEKGKIIQEEKQIYISMYNMNRASQDWSNLIQTTLIAPLSIQIYEFDSRQARSRDYQVLSVSILTSVLISLIITWGFDWKNDVSFSNSVLNQDTIKKMLIEQSEMRSVDSTFLFEFKEELMDDISSKSNSTIKLIETQNERINRCTQIMKEHTSILNRNAIIIDSLASK